MIGWGVQTCSRRPLIPIVRRASVPRRPSGASVDPISTWNMIAVSACEIVVEQFSAEIPNGSVHL
jgi:hypothetical protein